MSVLVQRQPRRQQRPLYRTRTIQIECPREEFKLLMKQYGTAGTSAEGQHSIHSGLPKVHRHSIIGHEGERWTMGLYRLVAGPNQCLQCNTPQCGGCPAETSRTPEGLRTNPGLLQEVQVEGFICQATSDWQQMKVEIITGENISVIRFVLVVIWSRQSNQNVSVPLASLE